MGYITSKELSEKWGISQRRIVTLAKSGKLAGAKQYGKSWMFPADLEKPADGRTRQAKERGKEKEDFFRFPLYVNFEQDSYNPPLSEEERELQKAQKDFFAGDFASAKSTLQGLERNTDNIYIKISLSFFLALISLFTKGGKDFARYTHTLRTLLVKDFPHKEEMLLHIPWLDAFLCLLKTVDKEFIVEPTYPYSPDVLPLLAYFSVFRYAKCNPKDCFFNHTAYEVYCLQFENDGYFYEAQELHLILFLVYFLETNEKLMYHHLKRALTLAYKHSMFLPAANYEGFYPDIFKGVLADFPQTFAEEIHNLGTLLCKSFSSFADKNNISSLYINLSKSDYQVALYANQGYTNKEIAGILGISERTVSNKLADIYQKLNINSKHELCALLSDMLIKKEQVGSGNR